MVHLGRQIRFSVDPFLDGVEEGCNSYSSKPAGAGLAVFLELTVELLGPVDPETGFVINVTEIDDRVREFAVPVFAERIRDRWRQGEHVDLKALAQMLGLARERLSDKFGSAGINRLRLKLNPFRTLTMDTTDPGMMYFSEKFEFAAMHKLWNDRLSESENYAVFGKCAHPAGHGHNYIVEVTAGTPADGPELRIGEFERVVDAELIQIVDHKNLNVDVPAFAEMIPTVENLATFAWDRLADKLAPARLHCVTVWETDRTYCSYCGPQH